MKTCFFCIYSYIVVNILLSSGQYMSWLKSPISFNDLEIFIKTEIETKNVYLDEMNKAYLMYSGDRYLQLLKDKETWRSNIKTPITRMFTDNVHNMVVSSQQQFSVTDRFSDKREEGDTATDEMIEWTSYCLSKEENFEALGDATLDAIKDGMGIVKTWYLWDVKKKRYAKKWGWFTSINMTKDYPILLWVSRYNLFTDWLGRSKARTRFIAERRIMTDEMIQKEYSIYGLELKKTDIEQKESQMISYKDFDSIKNTIAFYPTESIAGDEDNKWNLFEDDRFSIKKNKKFREVLEVHTRETITIYVNGVDHWTYYQLGPNDGFKYKMITFKKIPGSTRWVWLGYVLRPIQKVFDAVTNSRIDNVLLTVHKSFLMENWMTLSGKDGYFKVKPWKVHKVNDLAGIKELEVTEVKNSAYNEAETMFWMAQASTGVASHRLWLQDKVERVAWWAWLLEDAADQQLAPLMQSIKRVMAEIMKDFILMSLVYTDEEEFDKVLWEWNILKTLSVETVLNDYEYDFDMTSQKNKFNAVVTQQAMRLLEIWTNVTDAAGKPIVDVEELLKIIADGLWLESDVLLTDAEYKQALINHLQANQAAQWWGWTDPRSLQTAPWGWANIPPELTTNAQGVN